MTSVRPAGLSRAEVFVGVVRRSGPHLLEASVMPTALFYGCLTFAGLGVAFAAALVWLYASVLVRLVRRRPIPPLLVLGVIGITVRTRPSPAGAASCTSPSQWPARW